LPGGLVVPGWVEGQFAEEFTGGGVDDADVQVLDEQQDAGSGVGAADADVVQPAAGADGDVADLADAVAADPVVGIIMSTVLQAGGGAVPAGSAMQQNEPACGSRQSVSTGSPLGIHVPRRTTQQRAGFNDQMPYGRGPFPCSGCHAGDSGLRSCERLA
jgi:hypothetical protein